MAERESTRMQLISPAFRDNSIIPVQYTCQGQDVSPPLNIFNVPVGAKSLALIVHDPDAPGGDFLHWLVWDVAANTETIKANSVPTGAIQGPSGFGANKYAGPCPPSGSGVHHYVFELYALDTSLNLASSTQRNELVSAMKDHTLDKTKLTGLFSVD